MAKIKAIVKLQLPAGKATPAPPVGPALGPHGVSGPKFVQEFNDRTRDLESGLIVPVVISIFDDKSFQFIIKTPPTAILIKKALGLDKGSKEPNKVKVGKLTQAQVEQIAQQKMKDLNTDKLQSACQSVKGSARSMGVEVEL